MGNYFMLPRYPIWGKDEILLQTPLANYTLGNLEKLFADMGVTDGASNSRLSSSYHEIQIA